MERFSFPMLSPADIFAQLKHSLEIPVRSEEDITKPRPDTIKEIYTHLLELCYHQSRSDFLTVALDHLKQPENFTAAVAAASLFKHLHLILSRIGCKEDPFRIQDLLNPDFKRTRRFLSAFINYMRFMAEEEELIYDQNRECVASRCAAEEYFKKKEEYEKLLAEVQGLKRKKAEQQPLVTEKLENLKELQRTKAHLEEERRALESQVKELELEAVACEETKQSLAEIEERLTNEIQNTERERVSSPEKVLEPLEVLKKRYENELEHCQSDKAEARQLLAKVELLDSLHTKVKEACLILENCEVSMKKFKELKKTVDQKKQQSLELDKAIRSKELTISSLESDAQQHEDRLARLKTSHETKLFSLQKTIEQKQQENSKFEQQNKLLEQQVKDRQAEFSQLEAEFAQKQATHHLELERLETEHLEIIKRAEAYKAQVLTLLASSDVFRQYKENLNFHK